jgi:hypothetical protein
VPFPVGKYQKQPKLKGQLMKAGVNIHMLAEMWRVTPPTARGRLNGNCPITLDQIAAALRLCEKNAKKAKVPA